MWSKPESGLKQRQVQKQAMALGLGVGVVSPEQESLGGAVTEEGYQTFQAEVYGELGFYGKRMVDMEERMQRLEELEEQGDLAAKKP